MYLKSALLLVTRTPLSLFDGYCWSRHEDFANNLYILFIYSIFAFVLLLIFKTNNPLIFDYTYSLKAL